MANEKIAKPTADEKKELCKKKIEDGVMAIFSSEKYIEYLKFMTGFNHYSVNNQILIWSQRPTASLVAGYTTWKKKGRVVRQGEKGIMIYVPCIKKESKKDNASAPVTAESIVNGSTSGKKKKKKKDDEEDVSIYFKIGYVFDISQTEGEDLPELEIVKELNGDFENFDKIKEGLINLSPLPVHFRTQEEDPVLKTGSYGYCSPALGYIVIKEGVSQAQTLKTLVHEVAHALLEHGKDDNKSRSKREVEAESVAFLVSDALGLDTSDYSFGYIASWSKDFQLSELKESLDEIYKTYKDMLNKLSLLEEMAV